MRNSKLFVWTKWLALTSAVLMTVGCGGGGGSTSENNDTSAVNESSSVSSESVSSVSSESVSSVESNATVVARSSSITLVTVSGMADSYILEATVKIGNTTNQIQNNKGEYEWFDRLNGVIVTEGGAYDLAKPISQPTSADPKAFVLKAPDGYSHINPFTTLKQKGVSDLNATYPLSAAYQGEDGLVFNFDVAAAGKENVPLARESAKASLEVAGIDVTEVPSSHSGDGVSYAAERAGETSLETKIKTCQSVDCLKDILLGALRSKYGGYYNNNDCILLPGVDECLNYAEVAQATGGSTSSTGTPNSGSSSSSSGATATQPVADPFPSTGA